MKKSVTLNDLVLFAYNEVENKEDIKKIKQAITKDHKLKKELVMILRSKKIFDNSFQFPRKEIIDNILNYSKALSVLKFNNLGKKVYLLN
jgi:hypothetical protein